MFEPANHTAVDVYEQEISEFKRNESFVASLHNNSPRDATPEMMEEQKTERNFECTPFDEQPEKFFTAQDKLNETSPLVNQNAVIPPTTSPEVITDLS